MQGREEPILDGGTLLKGLAPLASAETRPAAALVGASVGGYRIVRELGSGGMGIVYLAEHPVIKARAAVKVLRPELAAIPAIAEHFVREARVVAMLVHPNAVRIYDLTVLPSGQPCIVMEFIEGKTLDVWLEQGPLGAARSLNVLLQIGSALAAAHRRGIVHRDVKPQNIVLLRDEFGQEQVKLLDFGLAKLSGDQEGYGPGLVVGTPQYMAPEQIRNHSIDARTDVYSLGVLGYLLLAHRLPFEGNTNSDLLMQHLLAPPPPLRAEVPPAIAEVLLRALAKEPERRFEHADAFCRALTQACRSPQPIEVARSAPVQREPPALPQAAAPAEGNRGPTGLALIMAELGPNARERQAADHYTFLGVDPLAEEGQIGTSIERLEQILMRASPSVSEAERVGLDALLSKLQFAREDLLDARKRVRYDADIGNLKGILRALKGGMTLRQMDDLEQELGRDSPQRLGNACGLALEAQECLDNGAPHVAIPLLVQALQEDPFSRRLYRLYSAALRTPAPQEADSEITLFRGQARAQPCV